MQLDFFRKLLATFVREPSASVEPPLVEVRPPSLPASKQRLHAGLMLNAAPLQVRARKMLEHLGRANLARKVVVRWNGRMRSTAGTAHYGKSLISLNPKLQAFGENEVERTFLHELAHLLAHDRAGRRRIAPHGREWRQACRDLGLHSEPRCHDLPLPRREIARRYIYECPKCRTELRRVRPLRKKAACLQCCRTYEGGRYDERFRFRLRPAGVAPV